MPSMLTRSFKVKNIPLIILAVRLPSFVMRQDVSLRLAIHHFDIVLSEANGAHPVAAGVDEFNLCGSSLRAARDRHRHQAYG